jgi:hypothetical protein
MPSKVLWLFWAICDQDGICLCMNEGFQALVSSHRLASSLFFCRSFKDNGDLCQPRRITHNDLVQYGFAAFKHCFVPGGHQLCQTSLPDTFAMSVRSHERHV